jgi:succinoglycan biosynthesis transport protein ExoP
MSLDERAARPHPEASEYEAAEEEQISRAQVRHLLHAPLRRPLMVLLPWGALFLVSVAVLFALPKQYRSSALILIESEKVPDSFVPKVATEDTVRRISDIRPEILSRTRLEKVIAETNPYPEIDSVTRAVDTMRDAIWVNPSGSDGFTIEFTHKDPRKAQEVTDRLVTLFIAETVKARGRQVEEAVDFLVTQVNASRAELEKKDEALRRFKEQRMGRLPEQLQTNLATMQMLQRELQAVEESLFLAREKRDALARGASRKAGAGAQGLAPADSTELDTLRDQLASLRSRYTDAHPDVESLRSRIARAEARQARTLSTDDPAAVDATSMIARAQLQSATQEVQKLEVRQADLERRIDAVRAHVEETPRTEQELANLTRDYNKLSDNYTALLSKQLEAQMAGRLEQRWKGDRFRMLDPAHLPERPDSPRPRRILGLGFLLGLLAGLGASLTAEILDPTVRDAEELQALFPCPVLARIPHLPAPPESLRS